MCNNSTGFQFARKIQAHLCQVKFYEILLSYFATRASADNPVINDIVCNFGLGYVKGEL